MPTSLSSEGNKKMDSLEKAIATIPAQQMTKEDRYASMIDYLNTVEDYNFHNGMKLIDLRDNYAACKVMLTQESMNPQGIAHGGIIFSLCDLAAGYAVMSDDRQPVTQQGNINFFRPGVGEYLFCEAEPIKVGKNVSVVESKVYDDQNHLIAEATYNIAYY